MQEQTTIGEVEALRDAGVPEHKLPQPAITSRPSNRVSAPAPTRVPSRPTPQSARPAKHQTPVSSIHPAYPARPPKTSPGITFLVLVGVLFLIIMMLAKLGAR